MVVTVVGTKPASGVSPGVFVCSELFPSDLVTCHPRAPASRRGSLWWWFNNHFGCLFTDLNGQVGGLDLVGSPWIDQCTFTLLYDGVP